MGSVLIASFVDTVEFMQLDLSSRESVKAFADAFKRKYKALNRLINNAGIMAPPQYAQNADGLEMQFGTNHLGHFALTAQLLDALKNGAPSRVVTLSSFTHRRASVYWKDMPPQAENYVPFRVYGMTKLSNLLFTYELERRLRASNVKGVIAVACHPGVTQTNLVDNAPKQGGFFARLVWTAFQWLPISQPVAMGALPTLYAATVPQVQGGEHYGPDGFQGFWGHPTREQSSARSHSVEDAQKLWALSEQLTGVSFDLSL